MGLFLMLLTFIVLGLCLAEDKKQRRGFLGGLLALLYFPVGVLMALTKKYK